jgi:hypothetical protein
MKASAFCKAVLSDIARILEVAPELRSRVPAELLAKIPR